jgi:hypothetical protein
MRRRIQRACNSAVVLSFAALTASCAPLQPVYASPSATMGFQRATTLPSSPPTIAAIATIPVEHLLPSPTAFPPNCPPHDQGDFPSWALPTPSVPLASALHPRDFVGLVYFEYPPRIDFVSGGLIVEETMNSTDFPTSDYFTLNHIQLNGTDALWLSREICTAQDTYLQVVDVLDIFPLPRTQVFFSHGCASESIEDPEIVAIIATERPMPADFSNINPLGGSSAVLRAWRASRNEGRFVEIGTEGLSCLIVGAGHSFPWDEP